MNKYFGFDDQESDVESNLFGGFNGYIDLCSKRPAKLYSLHENTHFQLKQRTLKVHVLLLSQKGSPDTINFTFTNKIRVNFFDSISLCCILGFPCWR